MKKIKCPLCGKELIRLNDIIEDGIMYKYRFDFWCDNCNLEIDIFSDERK